jgi:hypothetical protein
MKKQQFVSLRTSITVYNATVYVNLYFKIQNTCFGPKRPSSGNQLIRRSITLYACQYLFSKVIIIIINFTLCFCPVFLLRLHCVYWLSH